MNEYLTMTDGDTRLRWVYDEEYQTRGSYGLDTPEETKSAEDDEISKIESGEWVALGCILESKTNCKCPDCNGYHERESIWGIVIEPDESKLREYAIHQGFMSK